MIIWKEKERPEIRGETLPCSAFRWTFQISWTHIGFVHQYKLKENNTWYESHQARYEINITKHFLLGSSHLYYDGPHCAFSIGWVHFCWGGNPRTGRCTKCMPEE